MFQAGKMTEGGKKHMIKREEKKKRRPPENGWKETAKENRYSKGMPFYEIDPGMYEEKRKEKRWKAGREARKPRTGFVEREFW